MMHSSTGRDIDACSLVGVLAAVVRDAPASRGLLEINSSKCCLLTKTFETTAQH